MFGGKWRVKPISALLSPPPPPKKKKKIGQIVMKEVDLVVKCPVTQHFK